MNAKKFLKPVFALIFLLSLVGMPVPVAAEDPVPCISVYPTNSILGGNWPVGMPVTLTIDNPNNGFGVDYSDVLTPGDSDSWIRYVLRDFDVHSGDLVTLSNGATTKTLVVSGLAITGVDMENDVVSGVGTPGDTVRVELLNVTPEVVRWAVVTEDGNWSADFSTINHPWDSQTMFDLVRGSTGQAIDFEDDGDGDATVANWHIPDPVIKVWINENRMEGYDWVLGTPVTIEVDDPGTLQSVDYIETQTVVRPDWDPNGTIVWFNPGDSYQLKPGDLVTMTDGVATKTHTITQVTITGADVGADTVTGTAAPGTTVGICLHVDGCLWRWETADVEGNWLADFSVSQDENPVFDIRPGTSMDAVQWEEDGDGTGYLYYVPNPNLSARLIENEVHGYGWALGNNVMLLIDDPNTPEEPDYIKTDTVTIASWDPNQTFVQFRLWEDGFTLQPGMLVTMTEGETIKTHIVTNLVVAGVDIDADTIFGTATPGSQVDVGHIHCDQNGCYGFRRVFAEMSGNWLVDFSVPGEDDDEQDIVDITPGMGNEARQCDEDGDCTQYGWRVPNPQITVGTEWEAVFGGDWPLGATVYLTIDDPNNGSGIDYSDSQVVSGEWLNTNLDFNLGGFDVQPGHIVTFTDGTTTKVLTVSQMKITDIDADLDLVFGIANPFGEIQIDVRQSGGWPQLSPTLYITADQNGDWTADFAGVWDIATDHEVFAHEVDEDGDVTMDIHGFYNAFSARITENEVHGYQWTFGFPVNLTIDDPNTPQAPDYTRTETVTYADWDPNQTFVQFRLWEDDFTLQPGMFITMTDGSVIKTHTVTDLVVLGADAENDTVWGTGTPGTWVEVGHLCDNEGCAIRRTVVAVDGTWLVDFSVPGGSEPDEQKTFDLQQCYGNEARQLDEDGDNTQYGWDTYCPPQIAFEHYLFNLENPLLSNLIIRQAIALGTDRQRILDEAFLSGGEYGQLVNVPVPPGHPYQAPASEITTYPYNPAESESLLAAAGWVDEDGDSIREKDGQRLAFVFKTTLNPLRVIAAQIFRENMAAIGIEITVVHEPNFLAPDGALVNRDFDIAEFAWLTALDYDGDLLDLYLSDNEQNYGGYVSPDYDTAQTAFHNATTEGERISSILAAQQILTADLPAFYLFTRESITPHQTPTGTSVTLTPLPEVTINYTNVSGEGVTAALAVSLNPADLPQNTQLVDSAYEIGTTAMFETVQVCLAYLDHWMSPAQEAALRLYHYHGGIWLDVTDSGYPDTVNNIVCGTATDFSLFVILMPLNQSPEILSVSAPIAPVQLGQTVTATVTFSDPNAGDIHNALFDWGDGTTTALPAAPPTVSAFHNYASPGVYTLTLTITDDNGESDTAIFQYVVIYDPNGGFVTGGGWIWSPAGAYTPDPSLTGKATFGFVSKYQKGAKVPTGNTEFQFHVADLNFRSTSYEWLVIAGSKAQYKGTGTINGAGNYGFMLTATDGSPDKFRIKIWDKSTGEIIYDNQLGAADDANPTTVIQGGSIVVHKSK